jgi:hypothetical protein
MKKFNFKTILIALGVLILFSCLIYRDILEERNVTTAKNIEKEMKETAHEKVQAWVSYYKKDPYLILSSNPYAYFDNEKFQEVINLGPEYMPHILREIEHEDGASQAVWAIRDISKAKSLPKYVTTRECASVWNSYVEAFPAKFDKLKEELYYEADPEKLKAKSEEIRALGFLILPLIAAENNSKLDEIAKELFKENIKQLSYYEIKAKNLQGEDITLEEKADIKLKNYKKIIKLNKNLRNLELYKINKYGRKEKTEEYNGGDS